MVEFLQALLLGIVQGITEWLPISSSGHLVIAQELFGIPSPLLFDIALHIGTLIAVIAVFSEDILGLLRAFFRLDFKSEYGRLLLFIILGSIPTAIIGFTFHDTFAGFFSNLHVVGAALIVTGTVLFFSEKKPGDRGLNALDSVLIGIVQGISIIPGISRSGFTIGMGLLRGVDKEKVAKFSFLISIPAILGAAMFEYSGKIVMGVGVDTLLIGMLSALISGYLSIKFLLKLIIEKKFHLFAYYCWLVGIIVILL